MTSGSASASQEVNQAKAAAADFEGLEEFNMDDYDKEEDGGMQFFSVLKNDGRLAQERDPNMEGDADSDSESDDYYEIRPQDEVFVAASCEEDQCMLEMYVYDDDEATMYVHHDLTLGAYPLCIEWLSNAGTGGEGNFCGVGLIDHTIEIWDLDKYDPMSPVLNVGSKVEKPTARKGTKKKGQKKAKATTKPHEGPVLCLSTSVFNRSVLASGSGDETVKVWDVTQNSCVHTYDHHSDKVQVVKWHPTEQAVMLSASFDRKLALLDVRRPGEVATVPLPAEAECAIWRRHSAYECLATVDDGRAVCYDVRKIASSASDAEKVLWTLQAHDVACTSIQDVPTKDCVVTTSLDGEAKVWSLKGSGPALAFSKNLQAGPLFSSMSNPDNPALLVFGGKCPVMWDLQSEEVLNGAFEWSTA